MYIQPLSSDNIVQAFINQETLSTIVKLVRLKQLTMILGQAYGGYCP